MGRRQGRDQRPLPVVDFGATSYLAGPLAFGGTHDQTQVREILHASTGAHVIAAAAIIAISVVVIGVVFFGLRRRTDAGSSQVTLRYRSGTTVTLDATEVEHARPSFRRR